MRVVAGVTGLEPAASGVTGRRSNQLSYTPIAKGFRLRFSPSPVKEDSPRDRRDIGPFPSGGRPATLASAKLALVCGRAQRKWSVSRMKAVVLAAVLTSLASGVAAQTVEPQRIPPSG